MTKAPRATILLAVLPAALVPTLIVPLHAAGHVPDFAIGFASGALLGLSIIGLVLMMKRARSSR